MLSKYYKQAIVKKHHINENMKEKKINVDYNDIYVLIWIGHTEHKSYPLCVN